MILFYILDHTVIGKTVQTSTKSSTSQIDTSVDNMTDTGEHFQEIHEQLKTFIIFYKVKKNIKYYLIFYFRNFCQKKRRKLYNRKKKRQLN